MVSIIIGIDKLKTSKRGQRAKFEEVSLHLFTCVTLMHSHELQDKEQRIVELNEAEKIEPFRRRRCK